ncbi:MAG: prolipoprotein diacylglyceryl transferase [Roseiflexaceae bacterium]|nr:prolipoprotein diacylglyceryl transferase [Roseiflexaceae bacterium]
MFGLFPPDDPFLLNIGFLQLRWYGVCIVGGAMLAAYIASRRAVPHGFSADDVWNQLMLGLALGVLCARLYYVAFSWQERFAGQSLLYILNPQNGGLAIHGALIGAFLSAVIYTRWRGLPFWQWADICLPTVLVGQAIGRLGNFFNQEAYGRPVENGLPPFGLRIEQQHRVDPFRTMAQYPFDTTFFHATFLYELSWNLLGFGLIMWLERRLHGWLRSGDLAAFYAIWYGVGRFWVEALRTDSLCTNGIGGACGEAFRAAQLASIALVLIGLVGLVFNHLRSVRSAQAQVEAQV